MRILPVTLLFARVGCIGELQGVLRAVRQVKRKKKKLTSNIKSANTFN